MRHYVAIVEDSGPETAVGIWFPDLPGCFSAGDTVEQAMLNATEAIGLYAEAIEKDGNRLPAPRTLAELRDDPIFAEDVQGNLVALVPAGEAAVAAQATRS
jgi:predicted RNase H-like HicB family nuclease